MNTAKRQWSKLLILLFLLMGTGVACKSSKKKNKCNTCPTWDQVDVPEDVAE